MGTFYLKKGDTRPVLEVALKNPDLSAFDLTGATIKLLIRLNDGTELSRNMVIFGDDVDGVVRYTWLSTDWDEGNLIVGPTPPYLATDIDHLMEYEVVNGTLRLTFPNNGYDILRIFEDYN